MLRLIMCAFVVLRLHLVFHVHSSAPDRNETSIDRLCQAGVDFKGRTWPKAQHGVQHVLDIVSSLTAW
jgi:hypothetical protein